MTRTYTQTRRAVQQAETRQRIVDAVVALHTEQGPAHTSLTDVAERAGVQRHTLYAHFPDERALRTASFQQVFARDPPPDPTQWEALLNPERLLDGLSALYGWFGRNGDIALRIAVDAEYDAPTRECAAECFRPAFGAIAQSLSAGLRLAARPALLLALSPYTWRTLVADQHLSDRDAAALMARLVLGH